MMRWSVRMGVVISAVVALPALVTRQWADERFYLYLPESLVGSHPWRLIPQVIDEIPLYLDLGVFRPASRIIVYAEHWFVVRFAAATGLPPSVVIGAVKIAMVFLLVTVAMLTIDQYRRAAGGKTTDLHWRRLFGLTAAVIGISLVLFNPATHPLDLFPERYLGLAAATLAIPVWFGRSWLRYRSGQPSRRMWVRVGSAVIIGALLASSVELTYLALPLGVIHLLLLSFASGDSWRATWLDLFHSEAFLLWALVVTGFLVVFIPTRIAIAQHCAIVQCYRGAELSLGADAIGTWTLRAGAAFFPVAQWSQYALLKRIRHAPEFLLLALAAAAFAYSVIRRALSERPEEEVRRRPRLPMLLVGVYFAVVVALGASLAAVSAAVQDKGWDISPWRETGFTWIGWSVVIAVTLVALFDAVRFRDWMVTGLSAILVVSAAVTSLVNQADMATINARPDTRLYNEVGLLVVNFDKTPESESARCTVLENLRDFAPNETELHKMNLLSRYLDATATNLYGVVFCESDSA